MDQVIKDFISQKTSFWDGIEEHGEVSQWMRFGTI